MNDWSDEDESLGRVILYRARVHGITRLNDKTLSKEDRKRIFLDVFNKAAQDKKFPDFHSLPDGVRQFLYSRGQVYRREYAEQEAPLAKGQLPLI